MSIEKMEQIEDAEGANTSVENAIHVLVTPRSGNWDVRRGLYA